MNTSFGGGDRDGEMVGQMGMTNDSRSLFTVSQWQELEHQALIFKYMAAGLSVPADLLLPIQKSFESISHRFFHHPTMNYYSFYGKKVDQEPGRCRRTDGKKWRCSKDAYPDSKYCERHMQRGRHRSRKPVESRQTATGSSSAATGSFQTLPLSGYGSSSQGTVSGTGQSHYHSESLPYEIQNKDHRYLEGQRASGEHSLFSEASISNVDFQINASSNYAWPVMPSAAPLFPPLKSTKNSKSLVFGGEYGSGENAKPEEGQNLQPFFEEWPRNKDYLATSSSTQLSISIPMSSPDFSATSSRSSLDHSEMHGFARKD